MLSASSTSKKIYLNNSISKTILCPASMCNKEKALRYFLHGCVQLCDEFFHLYFQSLRFFSISVLQTLPHKVEFSAAVLVCCKKLSFET